MNYADDKENLQLDSLNNQGERNQPFTQETSFTSQYLEMELHLTFDFGLLNEQIMARENLLAAGHPFYIFAHYVILGVLLWHFRHF